MKTFCSALFAFVWVMALSGVTGCSATRFERYAASEFDDLGPKVFATSSKSVEPRTAFTADEPDVVLQVVHRELIPEGARCELRVIASDITHPAKPDTKADKPVELDAYVATWRHRRAMDQTSIVCKARRYLDWQTRPGTYRVELVVEDEVASTFNFAITPSGLTSSSPANSEGGVNTPAVTVAPVAPGDDASPSS